MAPHGNEDIYKAEFKSDYNMCLLSGVRIILSIAAIMCRRVSNSDMKAVFLRTVVASRDVYVILPR